ncbi:MAG TPA: hypothetical protein VHF23_04440 [Gaiellaceae bacterium]|nr:hypothetical protein [Gaiellaceae bacterium]
MHALGRIHRSLVPDGVLLDVHPVPPDPDVTGGSGVLGRLDDGEFFGSVRATEAGVDEAVALGLFRLEEERWLDVVERFQSPDALLARAAERGGSRVPLELPAKVRSAPPPHDIRHHVVLRRLRALAAGPSGASSAR